MKQFKYDIVIIGSGIGGLTSGALLSKAGYHILVIEKLPFAGGRCATLDYHGYKIPTGAVIFEDEVHGELCREVGAEFDLQVAEPFYYYRIKGKDYPIPSQGVMKTMIGDASRDDSEAERVWAAFKRGLTWAEPTYSFSLYDWFKQYTDNPTIIGIFQCAVATMCGMPINELPAGEYFRMTKETSYIKTGGILPNGGGSLSDALVGATRRMGGEVWTSCPALQIKVKDEIATGVVVKKNNEEIEITAQAVISNAGPQQTIELVGMEHFSSGYLKDVDGVKSAPTIVIHLTSDKLLIEGMATLTVPGARRLYAVFNYPNTIFPNIAPKGKTLVSGYAFPASIKPPYDFKNDTELALQDLRDNIPDFDKHAQVLRITAPHGHWGVMGTRAGYVLPVKTSVEGLYSVGDASGPLGWWCSIAAVKSGRFAVEDVIQRFKPV
ncbi:phytoene desaturase family protein [Chloroflexota bacterium]